MPWRRSVHVRPGSRDSKHPALTAEVLGWHWEVSVEDPKGEQIRWREHPRPACRLNAEAELAGETMRTASRSARRHRSDESGADGIDFELGCFTHMSREPGPAPTYGTVERANYRRRPARVVRPATGTRLTSVICESCGEWVNLKVGSRGVVLKRRGARLLLGASLSAYVAWVYSGPTGEISAGRAVLLMIAFPSIFIALRNLYLACFADEVDLGLEIADDLGMHCLFSPRSG